MESSRSKTKLKRRPRGQEESGKIKDAKGMSSGERGREKERGEDGIPTVAVD